MRAPKSSAASRQFWIATQRNWHFARRRHLFGNYSWRSVKGPATTPIAQNTIFGWVLSGTVTSTPIAPVIISHQATLAYPTSSRMFSRLWSACCLIHPADEGERNVRKIFTSILLSPISLYLVTFIFRFYYLFEHTHAHTHTNLGIAHWLSLNVHSLGDG